jgi:hypothetical protein
MDDEKQLILSLAQDGCSGGDEEKCEPSRTCMVLWLFGKKRQRV